MSMIPPIDSTGAGAAQNSNGSTNSLNALDNPQTFMQLLVAELKYQDPSSPVDPTQFMAQTAQLTEVQAITTLQATEQTSASASLIGKSITASTSNGPINGVVTGVTIDSSGKPQLDVNGTEVALSSITQVGTLQAASNAGTTGQSATGASTPSTGTSGSTTGSTGSTTPTPSSGSTTPSA